MKIKTDPDLRSTGGTCAVIIDQRCKTNFDYDLCKCIRILDPNINQKMEMTEEERAEGMRIIIKYAAAWAQRRGELFDKSKVAGQVGKFIYI